MTPQPLPTRTVVATRLPMPILHRWRVAFEGLHRPTPPSSWQINASTLLLRVMLPKVHPNPNIDSTRTKHIGTTLMISRLCYTAHHKFLVRPLRWSKMVEDVSWTCLIVNAHWTNWSYLKVGLFCLSSASFFVRAEIW
jgi:hypothetical protein